MLSVIEVESLYRKEQLSLMKGKKAALRTDKVFVSDK